MRASRIRRAKRRHKKDKERRPAFHARSRRINPSPLGEAHRVGPRGPRCHCVTRGAAHTYALTRRKPGIFVDKYSIRDPREICHATGEPELLVRPTKARHFRYAGRHFRKTQRRCNDTRGIVSQQNSAGG